MFIKKLNQVKTVRKGKPTSKHYNIIDDEKADDGNKEGNDSMSKKNEMMKKYEVEELKGYKIAIDPHARYLAIYSDHSNKIYILTIYSILKTFHQYRISNQNNKYSLQVEHLPIPEHTISSSISEQGNTIRGDLNILDIKFTHCIQATQFLIIAYFPNLIHLFSVTTAKKVDSFILPVGNTIMEVKGIGLSIFISTYNGDLFVYEGKQLTKCSKYEGEWVRFRYDLLGKQKNKKLIPLYCDKYNKLFLGHEDLTHERRGQDQFIFQSMPKHKTHKNRMETSYDEFRELEAQRYCQTRCRYKLSACEKFLICDTGVKQQQRFRLRLCHLGWNFLSQNGFFYQPVVNQFHCIQEKDCGDGKYYYCYYVAIIGNHGETKSAKQSQQLKGDGNSNGEQVADKMITVLKLEKSWKHQKIQKILQVKDLKASVDSIYWIGPNILIFLDAQYNIYYVDFHISYLNF